MSINQDPMTYITSENLHKSKCSSIEWHKVGEVQSLFVYPLLSGSAKHVTSCYLNAEGPVGYNGSLIRNHMFVVYNEKTSTIETRNEVFSFMRIRIETRDGNTVTVRAMGVEDVKLVLTDLIKNTEHRLCTTSFSDGLYVKIKVSDCGEKVAKWLEGFTKNGSLRLGYILLEPEIQKLIPFQRYELQNCGRSVTIPLEYIPFTTLLPNVSNDIINELIYSSMWLQKNQPNIIVSTDTRTIFDTLKWSYIKIGDVIIHEINLYDRMQLKIDSETCTYVKYKIYCEVVCPGLVEEGNEVYILEHERKRN